jgi:hypothetical protein
MNYKTLQKKTTLLFGMSGKVFHAQHFLLSGFELRFVERSKS